MQRTITVDVKTYRARYNAKPQVYRALSARCWLLDRMWEPPTLKIARAEATA